MFRSLRKKTGAVFRKRKDKSSVSSVASVPSISWPIRDDSYPPSFATEEQSEVTINTAFQAVEEEEPKRVEERPSEVKQESNHTVVDIVVTVTDPSASHTTAVHTPAFDTPAVEIPAVNSPAVNSPAVDSPAVDSTIVDIPAVAPKEIPAETPAQEVEIAEEPKMDSYTPKKFVPFVETSAMRSNKFVYPASSHYGMVNPAIMSGFGDDDDDDDDSIWLVDDEETDPEAENAQTPDAEGEGEEEEEVVQLEEEEEEGSEEYDYEEDEEEEEAEEDEEEVEEEEEEVEEEEARTSVSLPRTNQSQPPSIHTEPEAAPMADAQTGFRYRINLALFDDDFATPEEDKNLVSVARYQDSAAFPPPAAADTRHATDLLTVAEASLQQNRKQGKMAASSGSSTPATGNPYVDLLEQLDSAMTEAYQRRLDLSGRRGDDEADDFSFGQRYQSDPGTSSVLVTHQRVPSDRQDGDRDCLICADTKEEILFPRFSPTASCTHSPNACLECLERSIRSDLTGKIWTDIRCPECRELLDYTDIQRYADVETFKRYETLALRAAMAEAENFFWCTSGCGSGQIHDTGRDQPIVVCLHCSHRSCFHHSVAWHQGLTCEEYDQLLADPDNFRSKLEIDNEAWATSQKEQLEADRAMAQGLLEEERRTREMRERRDRQERERTQKAIELARQIAARRKAEEEMSRETVGRTTKPCPGCGWAIEKNDGCSHMTCIKCRFEFCWGCGNIWSNTHSIYCQG